MAVPNQDTVCALIPYSFFAIDLIQVNYKKNSPIYLSTCLESADFACTNYILTITQSFFYIISIRVNLREI